jgi:hypothetical protein
MGSTTPIAIYFLPPFPRMRLKMLEPSTWAESQCPSDAAAVMADPVRTSDTATKASRCRTNPVTTNPAPIAIRV